jgi:threonine dehydrogenase-like Zn-dependent dehydrogenase
MAAHGICGSEVHEYRNLSQFSAYDSTQKLVCVLADEEIPA